MPQEKDEYVDNIIADIHRLGLKFEKITYTSGRRRCPPGSRV